MLPRPCGAIGVRAPPTQRHPRACPEDPATRLLLARILVVRPRRCDSDLSTLMGRFSGPIGLRRGPASPRMTPGTRCAFGLAASPPDNPSSRKPRQRLSGILAPHAVASRKIPCLRRTAVRCIMLEACLRHDARDDGWTPVTRSLPRGIAARGFARKKGARAPQRCDPVATQGSLAAPARGDLTVWLTL
jgi:hypothetical protein